MDGVNGVAGLNAAAAGQQQGAEAPSADDQAKFEAALGEAAVGTAIPIAGMIFALNRQIMSQASKPPQ